MLIADVCGLSLRHRRGAGRGIARHWPQALSAG